MIPSNTSPRQILTKTIMALLMFATSWVAFPAKAANDLNGQSTQAYDVNKCYEEFKQKKMPTRYNVINWTPAEGNSSAFQKKVVSNIENLVEANIIKNCQFEGQSLLSYDEVINQLDKYIKDNNYQDMFFDFEKYQIALVTRAYAAQAGIPEAKEVIKVAADYHFKNQSNLKKYSNEKSKLDHDVFMKLVGVALAAYVVKNTVDTYKNMPISGDSSSGSGTSFTACPHNGACFNIIGKGNYPNQVKIVCTAGSYNNEEKCISHNPDGKWASGCGVTNSHAHHYNSLEKAGNVACD